MATFFKGTKTVTGVFIVCTGYCSGAASVNLNEDDHDDDEEEELHVVKMTKLPEYFNF